MTPAVRRLLREHGLEASQVAGTGGGGRITREDVIAVVEAAAHRDGGRRALRHRRPSAPAARPSAAPVCRDQRRHHVPRRGGRGPRPDDPDAQGHRGPDDPRAGRARTPTCRWRSTRPASSRCARSAKREYQAKEGLSLSYVPFVVQGVGRGAQAQPDVQRPLDRPGPAGQAPDQHRRGGGGRRRPDRARSSGTRTSSRSTASTPRSSTSRTAPGRTSSGSTTSAAARSPSTTRATSAPTS